MIFIKTRRVIVISLLVLVLLSVAAGYYVTQKKNITIKDDGRVITTSTFCKTVEDLLDEQNIDLAPEDDITPGNYSQLKDGESIEIKRAFQVSILSDGERITLKTQPDTVDNLISKANISLGEMDMVEPGLDEYINVPGQIVVTRRNKKAIQEFKSIPFETVSRKDSNLPLGQKKVIQQGEDGQQKIITTMMLENGKVISKKVEEIVTKQPKPKIVLTGSMMVASRGNVEFAYTKKLHMMATAYTHTGNLTATGTKARVGAVAVDPKVISLGSRLYIDGYGFARAEDVGGAIKGDKIDLFMNTPAEANRFGRRWVTVYVLK